MSMKSVLVLPNFESQGGVEEKGLGGIANSVGGMRRVLIRCFKNRENEFWLF